MRLSSLLGGKLKVELNRSIPLPIEFNELTPAWWGEVLGVKCTEVKVVEVIGGTATKIRTELTVATKDAATDVFALCLKGGFDPAMRKLGLNTAYCREAEVYGTLGPKLIKHHMRLAPTFYAATDTVTGQGIVIQEDLVAAGYTFGEPQFAWPIDRVRSALGQLAILHGVTWGASPSELPFLMGRTVMEDITTNMLMDRDWESSWPPQDRIGLPDWALDRHQLLAGIQQVWKHANPAYRCIIHGDAHSGNTYLTADGVPTYIDYQLPQAYSFLHDVTYIISGALEIEDRRAHEVELLKYYLSELHRNGAPLFTTDEVWLDYRRHQFHGATVVCTIPPMQTRARILEMSRRYIAAVLDHQTFELLKETMD